MDIGFPSSYHYYTVNINIIIVVTSLLILYRYVNISVIISVIVMKNPDRVDEPAIGRNGASSDGFNRQSLNDTCRKKSLVIQNLLKTSFNTI